MGITHNCRGVYSAKDLFFSPGSKFLNIFPLLVFFSSREGNKMVKIFTKLFILFLLYPLTHFLSVFFTKKVRKMETNASSSLNFYVLSPNHILFIPPPPQQGQIWKYTPLHNWELEFFKYLYPGGHRMPANLAGSSR